MPTMPPEEYAKLYGPKEDEPDPDEERQLQEESDWRRRVARRGYLFDDKGQPWRVPDDLMILYREKYPELGEDLSKFGFKAVGRASDHR